MPRCGPRCFARLADDERGAVTIAELLMVLIVSAILLVAVLNGQTFVNRLAQRFFDGAMLETESRLLLQTVGADVRHAETLIPVGPDQWKLESWAGDSVLYRFADSSLWRNGKRIVAARVSVSAFVLSADSLVPSAGDSDAGQALNPPATARQQICLKLTLLHKGQQLDFDTRYPLLRRAPGS